MKVGLNLIFMTEQAGGTGTYVRELIPAMLQSPDPPRLTIFTTPFAPADFRNADWAGEVEWVTYPKGPNSRWNLYEIMLGLPPAALRRRLDVIHSPANVGPLIAPRVAKVVTLRDLIWLHEPERVGDGRVDRFRVRTLSLRSARAADRVLAFSNAAADDFVTTLGMPRGRIDVTPLGTRDAQRAPEPAAVDAIRAKLDLGQRPVVLCVAQKRPYKGQATLVRALPELDPGVVVVLAGASDPYERELERLAGELGVGDRVRIVQWLSDDELEALYRAATCFVLPSLIEGFGLPVVDAMKRDVPVGCSNRSALAEVAGDAALQFDPEDQAAVTGAVRTLLSDTGLRERLVAAGRRRAAEFTWERTAATTLAAYERGVAEKR